jgi:cytochrome c oxidase subunit III
MNSTKKNIPGINIAFYIIIITELMFFAGLISAYTIAASKAMNWPPADQPRLPFWLTLCNMLFLLGSGLLMYIFVKKYEKGIFKKIFLALTVLLGFVFLVIQGFEWVKLVNFGIQTTNGLYASYFYTLIALHGFHVFIGLMLIISLFFHLHKQGFSQQKIPVIRAFGLFWYFVSLLWPVLYFMLYI